VAAYAQEKACTALHLHACFIPPAVHNLADLAVDVRVQDPTNKIIAVRLPAFFLYEEIVRTTAFPLLFPDGATGDTLLRLALQAFSTSLNS
jgi:hypothetical protein